MSLLSVPGATSDTPDHPVGARPVRHCLTVPSRFADGAVVGRSGIRHPLPPLPAPPRAIEEPPPPRRCVLERGDTLGALAARHGVGVAQVLAANGLTAGSILYPGEEIAVPVAVPTLRRRAGIGPVVG